MIPKRQISSKQRLPLGEISQQISQTNNWTNNDRDQKNFKQIQNEPNLSQQEIRRLAQLKNKYKRFNNESDSSAIKPKIDSSSIKQKISKQTSFDGSFRKIQIPVFRETIYQEKYQSQANSVNYQNSNVNQSVNSSKSSYFREDFQRKIQESQLRIQTNIDRVEKKMKLLKKFYKDENRNSKQNYQKAKQGPTSRKEIANKQNSNIQLQQRKEAQMLKMKEESQVNEKSSIQRDQNNIQENSQKNNYVRQLKNINFVDQIKRKLQQIEQQKKSNLEKKLSKISSTSEVSNFDKSIIQQSSQTLNPSYENEAVTLAKFVPNLAESQVIETTDRQRLTDGESFKSCQSTVIENYQFVNQHHPAPTKYKYSRDEIIEQPQREEMSVRASPSLGKSMYQESSLDETQLVERNTLQGDFQHVDEKVQRQFTFLINRLAYQAEMDNKLACQIFKYENIFTSKSTLKSVLVSMIREYCQQNGLAFNQSMLQVNQMQIDPLSSVQKTYKQFSTEQLQKMAYHLKKDCDRNCSYFEKKIAKCFSHETVEFLVEELRKCHSLKQGEEFNVGNLTSYINMRTGKNLRNRYLYRILKRTVSSNSPLPSTFGKQHLLQTFVNRNL